MILSQKELDRALSGLKDFQQETVKYVFRQLFEEPLHRSQHSTIVH